MIYRRGFGRTDVVSLNHHISALNSIVATAVAFAIRQYFPHYSLCAFVQYCVSLKCVLVALCVHTMVKNKDSVCWPNMQYRGFWQRWENWICDRKSLDQLMTISIKQTICWKMKILCAKHRLNDGIGMEAIDDIIAKFWFLIEFEAKKGKIVIFCRNLATLLLCTRLCSNSLVSFLKIAFFSQAFNDDHLVCSKYKRFRKKFHFTICCINEPSWSCIEEWIPMLLVWQAAYLSTNTGVTVSVLFFVVEKTIFAIAVQMRVKQKKKKIRL